MGLSRLSGEPNADFVQRDVPFRELAPPDRIVLLGTQQMRIAMDRSHRSNFHDGKFTSLVADAIRQTPRELGAVPSHAS